MLKQFLSLVLILWISVFSSQTVINLKKEGLNYIIPCKVNGLPLDFMFDTGASIVVMSMSEFKFMLKNGYIKENDIYGLSSAQIANGDIVENTAVILREIEIGGIVIKNVEAAIIHNTKASLLLGQSAITKLGPYTIDDSKSTLTILNGPNNKIKSEGFLIDEVISNDSLTYLRSDMKPVTGIVYSLHDNGKLKSKKNYINGKENGSSKSWYENGQLQREGNFVNGRKEGLSKYYYKNGQLSNEWNYKDGKSEVKYWYENGQLGSVRIWSIVEDFKKKKMPYIKYDSCKQWYENGQLKEKYMIVENELLGLNQRWYENGQIKYESTNYLHIIYLKYGGNKRPGFCCENKDKSIDNYEKNWREDGSISSIEIYTLGCSCDSYHSDLEVERKKKWGIDFPNVYKYFMYNNNISLDKGCWSSMSWCDNNGNEYSKSRIFYNDSACSIRRILTSKKKRNAIDFSDFVTTREEYFYISGQLHWDINYNEDGYDNGIQRFWYENGQLAEEFNYEDGQRDGLYKKWYENGQLAEEFNYQDDKFHGLQKKWEENGQLIEERSYKDGSLLWKKCWDDKGEAIPCD